MPETVVIKSEKEITADIVIAMIEKGLLLGSVTINENAVDQVVKAYKNIYKAVLYANRD